MSVFGNIMDKIFHHDGKAVTPASEAHAPVSSARAAPAPARKSIADSAPVSAPVQAVDVGAVLATMADMKGGGGNYQKSIVDLLKLLDLDSGLAARKQLADELRVNAGADGSAEQNIALHRAVIAKLAENGGIVPDSLRA